MRRAALAALVCVAVLCTGCSTTTAGTPSRAPGLVCTGANASVIVGCLRDSLTRFWTGELHRRIAAPIVLDFATSAVPPPCRAAVRLGTAFTCPTDSTIYLTQHYVTELQQDRPLADTWYRLAATVGHEMGHVVQFAVHEPLVSGQGDDATSRSQRVEQQADCLSGVWAAHVGLDRVRFLAAVRADFRLVDSTFERRTHGDPSVRIAAVRRGLAGARPGSCGLVVGR